MELADRLQVSQGTIARWESGERVPGGESRAILDKMSRGEISEEMWGP